MLLRPPVLTGPTTGRENRSLLRRDLGRQRIPSFSGLERPQVSPIARILLDLW